LIETLWLAICSAGGYGWLRVTLDGSSTPGIGGAAVAEIWQDHPANSLVSCNPYYRAQRMDAHLVKLPPVSEVPSPLHRLHSAIFTLGGFLSVAAQCMKTKEQVIGK